jgi:hypothetical protein
MTPEGRAGLSISGSGKPIRVKPAPTNPLVPFVSNANPIGITLLLEAILTSFKICDRSEYYFS